MHGSKRGIVRGDGGIGGIWDLPASERAPGSFFTAPPELFSWCFLVKNGVFWSKMKLM